MSTATRDSCPVMRDLAAYERQVAQNEIRAKRIEAKRLELLSGIFNPSLPSSIAEAISDIDDDSDKGKALKESMDAGDAPAIGYMVMSISGKYWEARAAQEAIDLVDDEDDRRRKE